VGLATSTLDELIRFDAGAGRLVFESLVICFRLLWVEISDEIRMRYRNVADWPGAIEKVQLLLAVAENFLA